MPTVFSHPAFPLAVRALTGGAATSNRLLCLAALCSVLPDVDGLGFTLGVPYGSLFGHRGLTHSLAFAAILAACAMPWARWLQAGKGWTFAAVFLATASHGLLDALTDGGLGVAFFSPFSNQRYFFPWRPIPAAPLGLRELFSTSELPVLVAELRWIWVPCLLVAAGAWALRRRWGRPPRAAGAPAEVDPHS